MLNVFQLVLPSPLSEHLRIMAFSPTQLLFLVLIRTEMSCREYLVHFLSAQIKKRTEKIQIILLSWSFSWISDKASEELFRQRPERKVEAIFLTATEKLKVIGNCIEECGMLVELGRVDGKIMNNWNFGRFCHSAINTGLIPDICQFWYSATLFRPVKST